MTAPIGTIASLNTALTLVVFDARSATDWIPTRPAATKAQFTGHPAEVMRGLAKGDDATAIDVGTSGGFAFELEGKSGRIEAYRLDDGGVALIAPPRAWWKDAEPAAVDALFAQLLGADGVEEATELGELELASGKLALVYLWFKKIGAARDLALTVPAGGALGFGDGYGEGQGLIVDLPPGTYRLSRHEELAPWDATLALVAMYLVPA
ncbi:MAG: hypothetical protein K8W52_01365 [Deltaproteobacteria bacterium]|nr:hypothetical protein [Deltaproteobacteria bacterium]